MSADMPLDPGYSDELVVAVTRDTLGDEIAALVAELLTIGTTKDPAALLETAPAPADLADPEEP